MIRATSTEPVAAIFSVRKSVRAPSSPICTGDQFSDSMTSEHWEGMTTTPLSESCGASLSDSSSWPEITRALSKPSRAAIEMPEATASCAVVSCSGDALGAADGAADDGSGA